MYRRVPVLTLTISPIKRAWITLAGCNFNCKGCFTPAKWEIGKPLEVGELLKLFERSCNHVLGETIEDVGITGGEPTLYPDYLVSLVRGLSDRGVDKISLSTNGYLLNEDMLKKLEGSIDWISLDLKAYDRSLHKWYTGKDNADVLKAVKLLHEHDFNFRVETLFIPGIIGYGEIESIAKYLSSIDSKISYKVNEFAPEYLKVDLSRRPTREEMLKVKHLCNKYLDITSVGKSCGIKDPPKPSRYRYVKILAPDTSNLFRNTDAISALKYGWDFHYIGMNQF